MRIPPRWLRLALVISAATALLAFAACGGDDDNSNSATPTFTGVGAVPTNGGDSTATDQPDNGDEDALSAFEQLSQNTDAATGKVSYTTTDTDADGTVSTSTFTLYSKPPNSRWDSGDPDDPTALTILIATPDTTYSCTASEETCIAVPGSGSSSSGLFAGIFNPAAIAAYAQVAAAAGISIDQSSENIAGSDANCFSWDDTSGDETTVKGKMCFDDAGLLLLMDTEDADGSKSSMRATEATTDVPDSDFEPPYPVTTLPG